ncbi:hypothetical protein KVR01_009413 [Diaporthe batatas]|uniref:uncharacterized protein n=1 Tax=Diaporthe batatas TaxID=748121 RepID=UPI001D0502B2|nr:uncharacterized protein KVR01_009413 [Diaporthe batatas]KAG8161149.1 hypothetical protein KVR01_009413 [Diaporthe batatas]
MTAMDSIIPRSALAVFYLCSYAITYGPAGIGVVERFVGHVHRAFWCATIEEAVLWPIYTVTFGHVQHGFFRTVLRFLLHFGASELGWSRYRRWVQLLVLQGSLSPFPTGTPSLLGDLSTCAAVAQGVSYFCIILILDDINAGLKMLQDAAETKAAIILEGPEEAEPLFENDHQVLEGALPGDLLGELLLGLGDICGLSADMFNTVGWYLERMAIGALVTGCVNAYNNTHPSWRPSIFRVGIVVILAISAAYWLEHVHEAWDEEDARAAAAAGGDVGVPRRPLAQRLLLRLPRLGPLPKPPVGLHDVLDQASQDTWQVRAAMWPDDARRDFYASVLAGDRASSVEAAFLVTTAGLIGQSEFEDLWRSAGLTTGVLLLDGDEASPPAAAAAGISGWILFIWDLPAFVSYYIAPMMELCFGIGVVIGAIAATFTLIRNGQGRREEGEDRREDRRNRMGEGEG